MTMPRRALLLAALLPVSGRLLAQQAPVVLSGRVLESVTRAPVAGADVFIVPDGSRTVTDGNGAWRLSGPDGALIRVRRLGYAPRALVAREGVVSVTTLDALPVPLDALVVTGSRREERLGDAVQETELISRADIERSGASDVGGTLTQTTGIQLEGGVPAGAGVYLQGLGSQRVLILLDGQPLVGRINGTLDLSRIPTSIVDHMEVVRGPMSTLYGSDAMGGVINIITRSPEAGRVEAGTTVIGGSQGRRELSGNLLASRGALGGSLELGLRRENLAPGLPGGDATYARRVDVAPKLRWQIRPNLVFESSLLGVLERQRYLAGQLYTFADNQQWTGRLAITRQSGRRRLAATVSLTRFDHLSRQSTASSPASDSGARDIQQLEQLEITYSAPAAGGIADAGVVLRREAIHADRVDGTVRSLNGIESFLQNTWGMGALTLTPGIRLSSNQQWGSVVTPRLAAMLRLSPVASLRASVGAGYRAPDFKELYLDFANPAYGYAVKGNTALRPEHSTSVSTGIELVGAHLFARGSAYATWFRDFIDVGAPDVSGTYRYANVAQGTTRGVEVEAGWTRGALRVEAGAAVLDARDGTTGGRLPGRAPVSGRLTAATTLGSARFTATVLVTGRTPVSVDTSGRVVQWREAYGRFDVRATAPLLGGLSLVSGIDNLFDHRLGSDWPGFTGRRGYLGMTWAASR